jgi:hypothetical protein
VQQTVGPMGMVSGFQAAYKKRIRLNQHGSL